MAFCTNCGTKVENGVKFCPECGTQLMGAAPAQPEPPVQPAAPVQPEPPVRAQEPVQPEPPAEAQKPAQQAEPVQQPAQPPKKKGKLPLILGIAAAAAVVVVGVIIAVVLLVAKNLGGAAAADNPDLGLYNAASAEMFGVEVDVADMWEKGFTVELKEKGKCAIAVDGENANGKWTLEDGALHISGGGLDCDGTLENGVMTLDNVLGTGMKLTFAKEGASLNAPAQPALPGGETTSPAGDPAQWNALQQKWNGVWYGVMQLTGCTGKYESFSYTTYDVYLDVAVDANGTGEYRLYDADELIGAAFCQAQESVLNTTEGVVFGQDMYAYNWMFLPDPNFDNTYCMTDEITDGDGDVLGLCIWIKPWGESWQPQIDSDFYAYPPNHESYMAMVSAGQMPTLGGSAATAPAAPSAGGSSGGAALTGPTDVFQLSSSGNIVMDYPTDTFAIDEEAIWPKIVAKDDSVNIMAVTLLSESAVQETVDDLRENCASCDDYSDRTLTLGGFDATCISYYDVFFDYNAEYVVDFAQNCNGIYGVKLVVNSVESLDNVLSDEVLAILDTIRLA